MTADRDDARRLARRVATAARRRGARRTLLLDVDGTLAPIAPTPESARVPRPTIDALGRLAAADFRVALVSGRPAAQVRRLVPLDAAHVFGSHGLEGRWPGGATVAVSAAARRRLDRLARRIRGLAAATDGVLVERKPAGIAVHDRAVTRAELRAWRRGLAELLGAADLEGLERIAGKRVVEIRPAGIDKGSVVRRLPGFGRLRRRDDSLVAIGDDRTDEDMFRALAPVGLTILVGRPRRTAARERLPSPAAVSRFLVELAGAG